MSPTGVPASTCRKARAICSTLNRLIRIGLCLPGSAREPSAQPSTYPFLLVLVVPESGSPASGRSRPGRAVLQPVQLGLDVAGVAWGAHGVREMGFEALLDVGLERLPLLLLGANALAVRADRQQALELVQLAPQAQDAPRDGQPGAQLVRVDWLGDEVVGPGLHPGQVLLLAATGGDEDEVDVGLVGTGADAEA